MSPQHAPSSVYNLLPFPFEWIKIPAGRVNMRVKQVKRVGTPHDSDFSFEAFHIPAFAIAKYPVTNAQYRVFMQAGGYHEPRWWPEASWQTRIKERWAYPRYWMSNRVNRETHPVVGASWFEAVAFCNWLTERCGENIVLPTEQQWQRAAGGTDRDGVEQIYPWGNEWDANRCNNSVDAPSDGTSPVTQFSATGSSFFGVSDMAGNVWEWCSTRGETLFGDLNGTHECVICGASCWNPEIDSFRVNHALADYPNIRANNFSFRIVRP